MATVAERVVVVTATGDPPADWAADLAAEFAVAGVPFGSPPDRAAAAVVIDGRENTADALAHCRAARAKPGVDDAPPVCFVAGAAKMARLAAFESGADACLAGPSGTEVRAQVRALVRWTQQRVRIGSRAAEAVQFSQRLRDAYRQIDQDMELAHKLQASFLPSTLPAVGPVRFAVSYRPCGQVGGDFYDAFRLDEHHVGFYVADAMGHGVPASLLTVFLKKTVQTKEIRGSRYRLVPPGEVLQRLNRELMNQGLADLPFITMVYGVIDSRTGRLTFARAAHPHPVYVPREGEPQTWESPGTLLGVFEADYPPQYRHLHPGDKLLLTTDGFAPDGGGGERLMAAVAAARELPIAQLVPQVAGQLVASTEQPDDFTLLGLEMVVA